MEGFRFVLSQPVVLRDLDGFGHVNNAVYMTYIENARVAYLWEVVDATSIDKIRNIIASVALEFRAPATYGETIEVGTRVERIGTKSFVLRHEIRTSDGRLLAEATTTQVMYDYDSDATVPVPDDWRRLIDAYEGRA
jgi:acyl-CoA thioester hydrolase